VTTNYATKITIKISRIEQHKRDDKVEDKIKRFGTGRHTFSEQMINRNRGTNVLTYVHPDSGQL